MGDQPHWLVDLCKAIRREYEAGASLRSLAEKYDRSKSTITRYVVLAGGEIRRPGRRHASSVRRGGILNWLDD